MGILRTDRVSGLGGANAIKGSVFFPHDGTATTTSGVLQVQNENDALTFGTGDFTIEFWFYTNRVGVTQHLYDGRGTGAGSNAAVLIQISDSNNIRFFTTSNYRITGSTTLTANEWHHVALTRTGSTHTLYVNGSSDGTYSASNTYIGPTNGFSAIGSDDNGAGAYGLNGFISNLRIAKELIYSAAFTVPTTELAPTSNTTLLCCQSPGDVEASFGGLTLTAFPKNTNSKGPEASRFTPNSPVGFSTTTDVGTQFGSTFDGVTTFDSQAYFVPPGGNTRERNRGRGLFGGGYTTVPSSAALNTIYYVEIQSMGNSVDFGDLNKAACWGGSMCASSTRGLHAGGTTPTNLDSIDFVTIASPSNATDFGNLTTGRGYTSAASNQTRGLVSGGRGGSPVAPLDSIDLITIATLGDASDFGDLSNSRFGADSLASPTRALIIAGSNSPVSPTTYYASIDRVEIATAGDATDFGDLTSGNRIYHACASSSTRGLIGGGFTSPADVNVIDFVTIASDGNSLDFGDLLAVRSHPGATSNGTRAIWAGGVSPYRNSIEFVTIASTGNAQDFGDIADQTSYAYTSGTSDSHGGLS